MLEKVQQRYPCFLGERKSDSVRKRNPVFDSSFPMTRNENQSLILLWNLRIALLILRIFSEFHPLVVKEIRDVCGDIISVLIFPGQNHSAQSSCMD